MINTNVKFNQVTEMSDKDYYHRFHLVSKWLQYEIFLLYNTIYQQFPTRNLYTTKNKQIQDIRGDIQNRGIFFFGSSLRAYFNIVSSFCNNPFNEYISSTKTNFLQTKQNDK